MRIFGGSWEDRKGFETGFLCVSLAVLELFLCIIFSYVDALFFAPLSVDRHLFRLLSPLATMNDATLCVVYLDIPLRSCFQQFAKKRNNF